MGTAKLPTLKTEDWDVMFADWLDMFAMTGGAFAAEQAVTASLWRCPALRRPYSKTFPRAESRIRAAIDFSRQAPLLPDHGQSMREWAC